MDQPLRAEAYADEEGRGEDHRSGDACGEIDALLARRGAGRRTDDLHGHQWHHQREPRDDRRHARPLRAEHHQDRFRCGQRKADVDRADHQQHALHGAFEIGAETAARLVQFGIGGEGDLVERRNEASGYDQRQEQRLRIKTQIIDREHPPCDEDVALALDDPEQLAQRQRAAEGDHPPRAPEIEHRAHPQPRGHAHYDCAHRIAGDRRIDERPDAEAEPRERQCGKRRGDRRNEIGDPLAAELEPPCEQRSGQGSEGDGEEDKRLDLQQPGDFGLAVILRHERGEQQLDRGQRAIGDQQQCENLPDVAFAYLVRLDQRAGKAPPVEEAQCGDHHLAHREQAVIRRIEQPDHEDRRPPGDELRNQLAAPAPCQCIAHACRKSFGGLLFARIADCHGAGAKRDSRRLRDARFAYPG